MKTMTSSHDPQAFHKLQELVRDIDIAMMTTVTPDGALHSRPMVTLEFGDDGEIWFFTSEESGKVHDLAAEHAVNLSYADPKKQRYVSVTGSAALVHDRERAKELWTAQVKKYFPHGLDDPHLALLRVRVETGEYWESPGGKAASLFHPRKAGDDDREHAKIAVRATPTSG
jgi:general stress protein 26